MTPLPRLLANIRTTSSDLEEIAQQVGRVFGHRPSPIVDGREAEDERPALGWTEGPLRLILRQINPDEVRFGCGPRIGYSHLDRSTLRADGYFLALLNAETRLRWYKISRAQALSESGLSPTMMSRRPDPGPPQLQGASFQARVPETGDSEGTARRIGLALDTTVRAAGEGWSLRVLGIEARLVWQPEGMVLLGSSAPYGDVLDLSSIVESLIEHAVAGIGQPPPGKFDASWD